MMSLTLIGIGIVVLLIVICIIVFIMSAAGVFVVGKSQKKSENMMYCKNCGSAVESGANFCKVCGKEQQ